MPAAQVSEALQSDWTDALAVVDLCVERARARGARRVHIHALYSLTFDDDALVPVLRSAPNSCRDAFKLLNFALLVLQEQGMPSQEILSHLDSLFDKPS